jgi:2-methylcitrate dehydratase PrpD
MVERPKGHPENPLTDQELNAKFIHNAGNVISKEKAEAALGMIRELENIKDTRNLMTHLQG